MFNSPHSCWLGSLRGSTQANHSRHEQKSDSTGQKGETKGRHTHLKSPKSGGGSLLEPVWSIAVPEVAG